MKPNRGISFVGLRYRCLGQRSLASYADAGSDRNPTYEKLTKLKLVSILVNRLLEPKLMKEFDTLADLSRIQAQKIPDARALIFKDQATTYKELDKESDRLANALLARGIKAESRVAILAQDSPQSYEILFACAKIKAVVVPINWRLAAAEVSYILNDAEVELLFVGAKFYDLIGSIASDLIKVKTIIALAETRENWLNYSQWTEQYSDESPEITISPNDIAVQLYTSGTTGRPKGVQLGHYSFFAVAKEWTQQGQNWMNWQETDKSLLVVPFFHIGGLWWAIRGFVAGAENILLPAFNPLEILEVMEKYRITKAGMVPAMIQVVLSEPQCQETDFSSLKYVLYGGSPIAESLLREAMQTFSCDFVQIYGMTETGNCAVCLPEEAHTSSNTDLLKSAGKPFPGVSVIAVDNQGKQLPPFKIGEIRIKSPANMLGYWKLPEATAKTLVDGWIHTGDAGYIDNEGYIYICDRIKDMICYAGENVYPAEIENILAAHPAIAEVGVIGVPDEDFGESIKAIVVLKPGMKAKALEIINFVRGKLADFKLPRSVEFVESLPRTPSGKIQKGKLREPYWQGYERKVN
ncbi:MAG: fatty acid--CoA ligase [Cyanobacteria bacterium P01_F01_bin.143]